jgi:CRP/FNR family transcriptional regulator
MRKIQCEACPVRADSVICDLALEAVHEFKTFGTSAIYRPRQVVFTEGAPSAGLYIVCHGAVKLYASDRFGREHILEVAGPGAVLGELSLDDGEAPLSVSAETLCESQLCYLSRERLIAFLQRHPMTAVRLLAALSRELATTRRKVRDLALKGAESRLASLLMQLAHAVNGDCAPGRHLQLRYTRRELAAMIGVSTETAIRLLARLKQKGAVALDGRDVVIADAERLTRVAHHDEAIV